MQFDFASPWTWHTLSVVLDVLITWYFIYHLTLLIKGTKAVQLANGIILIMVARVLAGWAQLTTVTFILDQIVSWSVIGIIVIFQPEIRRGLERLGRVSLFSDSENSKREQQEKLVKELDKAIQYMSKRRIGALITLEQKTGLEEYVETGIKLDALVTGELLINIFIPNTPLHDGAVIIKNNRVQVASAYLPLSDNAMIPKSLGTRHRAAVGISEVTDAITVVVSEETGGVTITRNGQFMVDLSQQEYLKYLRAELVTEENKKQPWPIRLARGSWNWGDK
ncbi:diadenylate cyclase CdaA [Lactobacillus delbrueckii]|uniref:Diadenylate cyclase n=1 Tax=Lactobacillus delbrueckii TaxID=1584 RepID=A0AAW5YSL1_9LACO|nr:diadenylate cyclase CdaA [Lactobacillus delbrueckii]TXG05747.1 TIGR00159 family protein [Lactobacillus delbrueckii subsp. bulgaricus]MCT2878238.1 TIGR00159 family protein [Lactobacillus delbrueckii]MCT3491819.1 TIGR00159 family protein [Lactobacillus delbrueckii]MDA3767049.1 diadenylate cyclase CdaA [Lactobacillus delbrueckii]MDF4030402.1 diadenylate cyclase CdaA [Lactobacillus delbrueckii]